MKHLSALCNCFSFIPAADDFALLSNRSHLHHKMGRFEEALQDATEVIRLKPDWPKVITMALEFTLSYVTLVLFPQGHFRRAVALRSSGRNEEALFSYLHCVAFEKKLLPEIREDIVKVSS
jgi:Tetratricopeptide repeat